MKKKKTGPYNPSEKYQMSVGWDIRYIKLEGNILNWKAHLKIIILKKCEIDFHFDFDFNLISKQLKFEPNFNVQSWDLFTSLKELF